MTLWNIIVIIACLAGMGGCIYNITSLIRKWKHNPQNWFDLLIGIIFFMIATIGIAYIGFHYTVTSLDLQVNLPLSL